MKCRELVTRKWIRWTDEYLIRQSEFPQRRTLAENDAYMLFVFAPQIWNRK